MNINIDANYLSSRLICSNKEKQKCLETVKLLCKLNTRVRSDGLLVLSNIATETSDCFLKALLHAAEDQCLLEDGIRDTFEAYLIAGNYHGKEFLKNLLITEGLSLIYTGTTTSNLITNLQCWFGAEFVSTYRSELFEESNPDFKPTWHEKSAVEEFDMLCTLSNEQITALLAAVDLQDLALSLRYSGAAVGELLLSHLSLEDTQTLLQHYRYTQFPRKVDVQTAQKRILALAKKV